MADKRISQLVERVDIANDDVLPIVANGAVTTNKVTISTIQDWMQENLDVGVTSVGITIGSTGTDVNVTGSPVTSSGNITINLPTASATNRGLLSAADWVTFNSKQDAGSFVTLDTAQTITAQKTFTTSGSSDTMIISHGSGSGFALDVLKAGNGEAIRVTKTSGTGNAMTISGGNFEAGTIVKTGGTSSQFLKADGSVDSNTYLTTGTAGSTYVPYSGAAANVDLGVYNITASAIIANGSGSSSGIVHLESNAFHSLVNGYGSIASGTTNQFNLYQTTAAGVFRGAILSLNSITPSITRTYTLPDASGTLALTTDIPSLAGYVTLATTQTITGAKTFDTTTSEFFILNSTNASGGAVTFRRNGTNVGHIGNSGVLGVGILDDLEVRSGIGKGLHLKTDGGKLTLSSAGSVTLDGALNGTSASFTGGVTSTGAKSQFVANGGDSAGAGISLNTTLTTNPTLRRNWGIFTEDQIEGDFAIKCSTAAGGNANTGNRHFFMTSTGAATFSSSVGIGVSPTAGKLHILAPSSVSYAPVIAIRDEGNPTFGFSFKLDTAVNGDLRLDAVNDNVDSPLMTFKRVTGNVGIGTATPLTGEKLTVVMNDATNGKGIAIRAVNDGGSASQPALSFVNGSGNNIGQIVGDNGTGYMAFNMGSSNTERMRITSGGKLLIGTQTEGYGLFTSQRVTINPINDGIVVAPVTENKSAYTVQADGNSGSRYALYIANGSSTEVGYISFTSSATSYSTSSDYRLKENVIPVEGALLKLEKLKPCNFNFKSNPEEQVMGFLAHEVQEVIPQAVTGEKDAVRIKQVEVSPAELDEEGNIITEAVIEEKEVPVYQGIDHSKLVPLLVAAIQELKTEIDSLKNQMQ